MNFLKPRGLGRNRNFIYCGFKQRLVLIRRSNINMIIVSQIRLMLGEQIPEAFDKALTVLRLRPCQAAEMHLAKCSVDARRGKVSLVCSVAVSLRENEARVVQRCASPKVRLVQTAPYHIPAYSPGPAHKRPTVIGFGPAGIFAGLALAKAGLAPLIIERGSAIEERTGAVTHFWKGGKLNPHTNVQFGEGGAGAFSDGKLTTRIHDPRCAFVIEEFIRHGAPEEVRYQAKPHIGTDRLYHIVRSLREEIIQLGGKILFDTTAELTIQGGKIIRIAAGGAPLDAHGPAILAVGHSARDIFASLAKQGVAMQPKPFSVGVRIEHLQEEIDLGLYGKFAGHPALPKGEYQFSHRDTRGRAVYTFCMCPGGMVVPSSSEEGGVVVNGMSEYRRDRDNANSALVVSVTPEDYGEGLLDGAAFQRSLEQKAFAAGGGNYKAPVQTVDGLLKGKAGGTFSRVLPSYSIGVAEADLNKLLPSPITQMLKEGLARFDRKLPGFGSPDAVLTGLETRTSSPVRILRNERFESVNTKDLFPCGEGAGYAGGIMSAAVDGLRVAEAVMSRLAGTDQ